MLCLVRKKFTNIFTAQQRCATSKRKKISFLLFLSLLYSFRLYWNTSTTLWKACGRVASPCVQLSKEERRATEGGKSIDFPVMQIWRRDFDFEFNLQRPPCQSSLFHAWETFLQEVEADSQSTSEMSNLLSKQVSFN